MPSTKTTTGIMPFLTTTQSSGRGRRSNQQETYPSTDQLFENFLTEFNHISPINYGNKSGSLWEGNHLLQLGVIIELSSFWDSRPSGMHEAERFMSETPGLSVLLKALDAKELQLPDAEILKRLKQKGASESVGVYCGLASILRKPVPKSTHMEDFKRWADKLRNKKVSYAESSAEATDPADPDFEDDNFDDIEEEAAHIIDEAEANDTAIAFIRMILMAVQESQDTTNGKPFPAVKRSPGKYYKIPTTLGTYTCWTDGSIVVKAFSRPTIWPLKVVAIAEIELKRHEGIYILPQHISQLNAQMYRIALAYKQSNAAKNYKDIPEQDRTVYLLCMNGKHFRACWVTYKAEWLRSLFGPFSKLGVTAPTEKKTRLDFQQFHVTKAYPLDTVEGREEVAYILLYIAFCVVRINYKYDEVAHHTK